MSDSSNQLMPLSLSAPGVNLGAYISTVNQIPILTAEQEKELAERYYYDQDLDAAKMLVMSHLRSCGCSGGFTCSSSYCWWVFAFGRFYHRGGQSDCNQF